MAACGSNGNATQQYPDVPSCLLGCATYPASGSLMGGASNAGNTIECRTYHASVALASVATPSNVQLHCPHAGPTGGNTCGTYCQAYAQLVTAACTGANAQFPNATAALAACANFAATGNLGDTNGNTVQCRLYHAGVALYGGTTTANVHCQHTGVTPTAFCTAAMPGSSSGTSSGTNGVSAVEASASVAAAAIVASVFAAL